MFAQYRYKGRYISASKAEKLSHLPRAKAHVITSIRDSAARKSKSILEVPGMLKDVVLKTVYAMEKDRQRGQEQRERRIARERERTAEFKRAQAGVSTAPGPERETGLQPARVTARRYPEEEEEEEEEEGEVSIPFDELPDEDFLMEEYFDAAIEVADIDGDTYVEQ
jgi:hypothetical protein